MQTTPFTRISSLVSADIFQMLLHADFKVHLKKLDFQYLPKKIHVDIMEFTNVAQPVWIIKSTHRSDRQNKC